MKTFSIVSLLVVFSLVIAACAPASAPAPTPTPQPVMEETEVVEPEPMPSIVDIAVEDGRFTLLVAALQTAGLVDTLQGEGPFTVFAPTDDAFSTLPEGTVEALMADTEALKKVLLYHVVSGAVKAEDVVGLNGEEVETLSGEKIKIKVDMDKVYINEAQVIITDIEGSNGVIHVIDSVILPPEEPKTIVDIAVEDGRFTTLVTALTEADLVEALQGEGPFTVFAPTDDAFAALPEGALEDLLADKEALTNVLLYHVLADQVMAEDVLGLDGEDIGTLSDETFKVKIDMGNVYINDAQVIITDIKASNGVIHVIDTVLLPTQPKTIVDIAVEDGRFTTLVMALQEAELVEALQGDGPFTVFAPTDDAFAALPDGALEALVADKDALTDVLLYHVVEGAVMAEDVIGLDGERVGTLGGYQVKVKVDMGNVYVDNAMVIITDIQASNGIIHVIDSVLLPETIVDVAVADGRFTTLVTALTEADLVEALQAAGPFTVFAPTDDAFALLPAGTIEGLLADKEALSNVLLYHVVDGAVPAVDVIELDGQLVETLSGESVMVSLMDGMVSINDATVIIADIETSNGIIHVIDAVLIP